MKRILCCLLCAVVMLGLSLSAAAQETLQMEPVTLIANSTANPGTAEVIALETFKEAIEESSNGLITVEIYSSGTLFDAATETTALMNGDIDMCLTAFSFFAESGSPWAGMFDTPYLFGSYDQAHEVLNGEIGQAAFGQILTEQNIKVLATAYIGTRQLIMRADKEVKTTADLQGVLLRVPTTASYVALAQAMNAVPTPMALDEVYLALQTGTIDAIEVPLSVMNSRSFFEVCKTLVLTNHMVNTKVIVMGGDKFAALPEQAQSLVMEAAAKAGLACDNFILEQETSLTSMMADKGLTVITPDVDEFRSTVLAYFQNDDTITKDWDMELFGRILNA